MGLLAICLVAHRGGRRCGGVRLAVKVWEKRRIVLIWFAKE